LGVAQKSAVSDVARQRQSVTQDMGFRKDIDVEVRAGARKQRIAGEDPGAGARLEVPNGRVAAQTPSPRPHGQSARTSPAKSPCQRTTSAAPSAPATPAKQSLLVPPPTRGAVVARPASPSRGSPPVPDAVSEAFASARGPSPLEPEVRRWLEQVSGQHSSQDLGDWLHDGRVLCEVANTIKPRLCPRINVSDMPFKQMENITAFIHACRTLGVLEKDVFSTVDLYEKKNMKAVVGCIYNLAGVIRTTAPTFSGPYLGVAQRASVTDAARSKQVVTQDMGYRRDVDAEVKAGVRKERIAGHDPATVATPARPTSRPLASPQTRALSPQPVASSTSSPSWALGDAITPSKLRLAGALVKH